MIEQVPPGTWARLAAWNAFLLQVYGDNLIAEGSNSRYVTADMVEFARIVYQLASEWLGEVHKAQASEAYRFHFATPYPLPHWLDLYRTDEQLQAMRKTVETARTRVASDLLRFSGDDTQRGLLRVRLAQVDSEVDYVGKLWTRNPTLEVRATLGTTLAGALDHAFEIGQLLAQPELIRRLY